MRRPAPSRRPRAALLTVLLALVAAGAISPVAASATEPGGAPPRAAKPAKPAKHALAQARRGPVARAALCATAPLSGNWHNVNANTNSITRTVVDYTCGDVILCDASGHCTGGDSYYSMNLFGKCTPTDCNWGRLRATSMSDGWIRSVYSFGFKTSDVWLKTYSYYGLTYLRVYVRNDFSAADGRTDYTTDEWMLR